jgi:hypothetical protein
VDAIHLLVVVLLALQLIQGIPQRIATLLIEDPGILLIDEVVIQFDQMLDAWTRCEFLLGCAAEFEEVGPEPDLFYVRLVAALGDYLLYRVFLLRFFVLAQPDQGKTATS